jgi:hypothetical protein
MATQQGHFLQVSTNPNTAAWLVLLQLLSASPVVKSELQQEFGPSSLRGDEEVVRLVVGRQS